jgi:hypothetical protein
MPILASDNRKGGGSGSPSTANDPEIVQDSVC